MISDEPDQLHALPKESGKDSRALATYLELENVLDRIEFFLVSVTRLESASLAFVDHFNDTRCFGSMDVVMALQHPSKAIDVPT